MPFVAVTGLNTLQLAMPVGGAPAARSFYSGVLQLPEIAPPPALAAREEVWFRVGAEELHLAATANFSPTKKARPALFVESLEALQAALTAAGVTTRADEALPEFSRISAFDPFGNRLEFRERRKSTVAEIRARFDDDVERFSNLETGQSATIDAPLALELVARAAQAATPHARRLLDIGCGAGNFALRALQYTAFTEVTLLDLSRPMLTRAAERLALVAPTLKVTAREADVREATFPAASHDVVVAGAVLHHLRSDAEWEATFAKIHALLAPGGSFWIFDLVSHPQPAIQQLMWQRYGEYLSALKDAVYRDHVQAYVAREDSPRPLAFQLALLERVGFRQVDVLHYHTCFAAFGGVKPAG